MALRAAGTASLAALLLLMASCAGLAAAQPYVYDEEDRVMFSFECKMNVMWRERYKKFAFYAPDVAVQTDCTFEDYMWHHVMVTFDDDGVGKLFVDGEQQYLENVDGTPVGKTFKTCMYPQLNVPATLDSPGSCTPIDPNPAAASPTCQFAIGKSCNAASHMGAWLLGFDGLVDEVVVYDRDLSAGNAVVADIMFKMPLYLLPRELEVPSGIQKDLTQGRVLYAKFNRVPCQMPELPINTTDAYDHAGLTAYIPDGSGGYTLDDFGDRMTINELSRQAIVYTGVPFKPPEIVSVASGGVTNQLPLGGKGASKLVITGAGFAKSPFAKCALIQPKPMEEGSSPDSWEPRYGPGLEPSIYNDYFLDAEDGSFSRKGLTVYSYSESGYMKLRMIRDDVALSDASVVEYTDPSLRTKQSNIAPYYHEFGYRRTAYAPEFGELGPRVSHSMYEQVTCDMPAAAFPSDRYTLVVSNDGGLTGASSNFIEVSEMSLRFDGRTNVTLPRPWTAWRPFAISFWFRPDKEAQADATLLDLGSGSTTARLSYTVTGSTTGYLQYTNGDDSASRVIMRPVDTSRGGFRVVELWHHVMVKVISRSDGIKVSVYLDGDIMYGTAVSQLSTPVPGVIGSGFIGNIDEVKIFKDPPAHGAELQRAFSREPEGAPLLWNYYRFNSDFSSFAADGNRLPAVCRGGLATSCTFQASEAPWEPSILYTINGRPASAMGFSSMKGNETIEVTGYNLAPSAFLTCTWGAKGPADAYEINTVFTGGNQDVCNDGVPEDPAIRPPPPPPMVGGGGRRHLLQQGGAGIIRQETLGRPDGHSFTVGSQPVYTIASRNETALTMMPNGSLSTITCPSPVMDSGRLVQFSVINQRTLTPVEWEVSEVGVECDGIDDYITMDAVTSSLVRGAFAFGLWVFPYKDPRPHKDLDVVASEPVYLDSPPETSGPPSAPTNRGRRLQQTFDGRPSSKRHSAARRSLIEAPINSTYPHAPETTVLAFQSRAGDLAERDKALLMYDGVRFFYYDSRIQDAFSEGPGSKPGMWHYVYVQVDQEGNGELHVDCELVQTFTTTSRPEPGEDGLLTICADVQDEDLLSSHFAGIIDELVVFNTAFASTSVDYEQQTCRSTKFDPAEFESFNSPNILSAYFDFTRYDKKECIYTQEPTPAPTTPEPAPAPTLPGGGRRLLSQPSRRDGDLGLVPNRDLMVHRYNIDYATLECGYVIMPDESPYERHGRVLSPRTSPLPLRESAPWVEATALRSTMRRSNIAGGVNMTFSGANFAPSKFLSVLLGGDLGLAETIKPVPVFDEVREDDTLSILAGAVFPVPKGVCNKDHDIAQVSNFSPELGTSRLSLLYRPDMEDLVGDIAVYNSFTQARTGRNQERETASQLFSQSVSTADPSFSPSRLREYTSCLWLRLAYPSDAFTPPANKHIGGWKFVCADSNGGLWINAQRMTGAADVGFWGPLMDAYTSTGTLFPAYTTYYHVTANVDMLNRHLVDAAWVWPRVLQDCELLARYYTSESYALDMTKGDAQVVITRDLALSNFHFDAWVYPYTVEGQQMILASQDGKWGIGLEGTSVMIYIYKSKCACKRCATCEKPCMEWFQMSSHRALVRPLRWSFITVGYSQATQGGAAEMRLVIDGVLMDSYTWNATTSPGTATDSGDMPLMVGDDPIRDGKRFQGQIAHIALGRYNHWSVTTPIGGNSALASYYQVLPYSSQLNVQCPGGGPNIQQARNIGHIVVFGDDLPTDLATPGVAKLLSNVSYDSQTDWSSTTLFGLPRTGNSGFINSDHLAHFTLTLRNKCKQKRPVGGADIAATIQLANSNVQLPLDIIDTLDANYHASFNATDVVKKFGVCSSDYSVFITYQAPDAVRYNRTEALEIRPAATSPRTTSIYNPTNPNTPTDEFINGNGCFGVVNRWEIQARDAQGCKKLPIAAGNSPETFEVTLTGPATIQANVTYRANSMGLYDVYWMAPAAGTYQLHAYMVPPSGDKVPVSGDGMCLEVCAGKSLEFIGDANNEGWIQVTAVREGVSSGLTDLELAEPEGFTIETWFSISGAARSGTNGPSINADRPYLLFKNKREPLRRSADQIKGYSLGFDPAYESLIATVYCGLGVYRNVTADLSTFEADEWVHASAVYNTTSYTLYLNGAVAARSVYDQALPAHPNMYNHPLVIGMGFRGYMDELKLWKKPRTHDEVVSTMYCPPYLELKDVAGYWSFNDKTEENLANMMGVGASCMPMQPDSVNTDYKPTCLVATIPFRESSFFFQPTSRDNTPLKVSAYGRGMGSPSARLSRITGPGLSSAAAFDTETPVLTVHAMDKCGFAYNRGFPRNARAADPTMEDPAAPRITDLFTTNVQPISTVYLSPDPPLESLPDGYPIILEGAMEPAAPPAAYEPGPCYADPAKPIATNSPGNTFNLTIYATRTGNSYLDIRLLGEPMLDHREMLGGPAFDFNATEYAPFILPITSGPPSTIEVREGALRPVTAGVPSGLDVRLLDVAGNGVEAEQALTCTITPLGTVGLSYPGHVTFMGDGNYVVVITAPSAGNYKLSMELNLVGPDGTVIGVIATSFDFVARAAAPRPLITASMPPAAAHRFEHTTVIHDDKLYVWGGAGTSSGAHRNDMWSLPLYSTEPTMGALAWKKTVTVLPAVPVEGEVTIKVIVDTLELFVAGRVQPTCADVAFVLPPRGGDEETILPYHLDKEPGCRSTETVFWVKLPEGVLKDADETQVHMYYGNPHPHQVDYERSADALLFYEGFEDGEIGSLNGTRLNASTPCGTDDADAGGFVVTSELAYSGSKSLKASFGARGALEYLTEDRMDSFTLRAAFYDNDALDSSHFMSPNYDRCRLTPGKKPLIPNPDAEELRAVSTAVGTYTLAHVTQLCVSTPWTSVNTTRSAKWHQLEVTSTPQDGLKMYIDGVLVKEAGSVTLDRVFLSAGFGVDDDTYEGLPTSMAMWDEIVLAALTPSVAVAAESIQDDDSVAWIPGRKWVLVETGDSPAPPPRQGHCSFLHDGSLYVYGGERAGYAFSDLWRFSFGDEEWELLSDGDLPARYDAACFFMPDTNMFVVNGGKSSRVILSDTWAYELTTGEWVAMEDIGTGGRFGHTAVYAEGSAYLFGGFTEAGFSRSLYKCFAANNPVGGCAAVDVASGRQVSPRFAHTLFSDGDFLYVHGGTNLESRMGFSTTWRYSLSRSVWDQVATDGDGIPALQHTGLLAAPLHVSGDARLGGFIVHGGTNMDDDNVYFLSL